MMKHNLTGPFTRRTVLRGLGAALALPWLESLPALARAAAPASKPPVRMCFWYVPNGVHLPTWFPEREGRSSTCPRRFGPSRSRANT